MCTILAKKSASGSLGLRSLASWGSSVGSAKRVTDSKRIISARTSSRSGGSRRPRRKAGISTSTKSERHSEACSF
eukprot:scaffold295555_cov28-Tisochrysis_lutea.AAC.6